MSRYKVLPLLLVVGLFALVIPLTIALADGHGGGTVWTVDSNTDDFSGTLSDQINIELTSLAPLGSDKAYEGWLVSDDGNRKESTGILTPDTDGNVSTTFSLTTHENLFGAFNTFVLTIEPVPDSDAAPSADVALTHTATEGEIANIRHLLATTPKGIAVGLREQTNAALQHARLSVNSDTLADVHSHACHVVNIIEGTGEGKGANFDATCGNPGDGFGVLSYAADTALNADLSSSAAAAEVATWAGEARDNALRAVGDNNIAAAKLYARNAEDRLVKSLSSAKTAYTASQNLGKHTLAAPPPPPPPDTGDPAVPNLALSVLIVGAILLLGGTYIYRRSRIRAGQTS
jgi:hypothetical protein